MKVRSHQGPCPVSPQSTSVPVQASPTAKPLRLILTGEVSAPSTISLASVGMYLRERQKWLIGGA